MRMRKYEALGGDTITETCANMVKLAAATGNIFEADFNGITLIANPTDSAESIVEFCHTECNRRAEEYAKSPEGIAAAERTAAYRKQAAEAAAEGILPFNTSNPEGWQKTVDNNSDGYGACGVRFAARWANYMERELATGAKLSDVADKASHEADKEGITGFMYGCAVSILSQVWTHGEELRRWHNLKTQIGSEGEKANESGGTLNPALLTIG